MNLTKQKLLEMIEEELEIIDLREDNKKLAKEISDRIQLFRDKGVL